MNSLKSWMRVAPSGGFFIAVILVQFLFPLPSDAAGPRHTRARLVSDVATAVPGSSITVGVLLRMDPGWHTYWVNPGEAGLPTTAQWTVPTGTVVSDLLWPVPEKTIEGGEVLTYGYATETMLLTTMKLPATLPAHGNVKLRAALEWLECATTCVPGSDTVSLTLSLGTVAVPSPAAGQIAGYRRALPRALNEQQDVAVAMTVSNDTLMIRVSPAAGIELGLNGADVPDFFPLSENSGVAGRTRSTVAGGGALILVPLAGGKDLPGEIRGVVVYRTAGGVRGGVEVAYTPERHASPLDRTFVTSRSQAGELPLIMYIGFAVIGGLLLNIMPCVLPVIALKIFGLVKMAGDEPRKVRRLGWMFSLGILVSFLVLALTVILLKAAGQQVGWGFQFQEPVFVIMMSALVFAFGLSLFGVFEIRLPGAAVAGVSAVITQQGHKGGNGYAASFAEGVFATILATPCTAPFLGSALGFAFVQPVGVILLMFAAVAFGMALPYLVLTARPAWLRFLPRPGAWMETAKQFMGFLMMATLLWLLFILGKQLGMEGVIWTGAFLLTVGVGCWLVGRFATLTASRRAFWATWAVAVLLAAGGYGLFLEGALDVRTAVAATSGPASSREEGPGEVAWEAFSLTALESHLQKGHPVFLDFTAEWCLTCKVNERTVIASRGVQEKLRASGIVTMKADWTNRNPDITRLLAKFGRSGVPLYVLFPVNRPDEPIVLPEVLTSSTLLEALEQAAPAQ